MRPLQYWLMALAIFACHVSHATQQSPPSRLAIIIDDIGYNKILSERAARLPGAFTLSILPFTPNALQSAHLGHRQGKELMLHAPMSNMQNLTLGAGGLHSGMTKENFLAVLRKDLNSLPFIKGMNNHMGSRLTQELLPMTWLMEELHMRGLYFVDSRTTALTVALDTAQHHRVPSLRRDVFLDDNPEISAVAYQLSRALHLAKKNGSAVAIGHPYPSTLSVLEKIQPLLAEHNITLVFVSHLLKKSFAEIPLAESMVTVDYCLAPPIGLRYTPTITINFQDIVAATLFDILNVN